MNDSVLSLKLRPRNLSDVVGQDDAISAIRQQIASGRLPRAWMFVGESGAGKTTLARIVALLLQGDDFGRTLTEEDWKMFPVYDIRDLNAADVNGVDAMRELIQATRTVPMYPSRYQVFILNEAHKLTKPAQEALLVPVENAEYTIWMLTTTDASGLIPAMHRRFETAKYKLKPLGVMQMAAMLSKYAKQENISVDCNKLADILATAGITAPAKAICALEKVAAGLSPESSVDAATGELDNRELCRALLQGKWDPLQVALSSYSSDEIVSMRYVLLSLLKRTVISGRGKAQVAEEIIIKLTENAPVEPPALVPWIVAKLRQAVRIAQ